MTGSCGTLTYPLRRREPPSAACMGTAAKNPYGQVISYGELARRVGRPNAAGPVGGANHHNPISIIVPCHRVIAAGGSLCGYGGGLELKRALLRWKGSIYKPEELPLKLISWNVNGLAGLRR